MSLTPPPKAKYYNEYIEINEKLTLVKALDGKKQKKIDTVMNKLFTVIAESEFMPVTDLVEFENSHENEKKYHWYFAPKYEGQRISCAFDLYSTDGILKIKINGMDEKSYHLNKEHAYKIREHFNCSSSAAIQIQDLLNGNRFEEVNCAKEVAPHDPSVWNHWKELYPDAEDDYENFIYPTFMSYLEKLIESPSSILELCGGDGALAKDIFDTHDNQIQHYFFYDLNDLELKEAQAKFTDPKYANRLIIDKQDVTNADFLELVHHQKVDFVIACGALTHEVLPNKKAALDALRSAAKALKPNGYALIGGHAPSWINSDDLEEAGFKVINMYSPRIGNNQGFYLARKLP